MNNDEIYKHTCAPVRPITERARKVEFRGQTPNESYFGSIEVISGTGDTISICVERAHMKKYSGKKWHRETIYLTLTREAWAHLMTAS